MNVFVTPKPFESGKDGYEIYTRDLFRCLVELRLIRSENCFVLEGARLETRWRALLSVFLSALALRTHFSSLFGSRSPGLVSWMREKKKESGGDLRVVCNHYSSLAAVVANPRARNACRSLYYIAHNVEWVAIWSAGWSLLRANPLSVSGWILCLYSLIVRREERRCLRQVDFVVTLSREDQIRIIKMGVPSVRTKVCPPSGRPAAKNSATNTVHVCDSVRLFVAGSFYWHIKKRQLTRLCRELARSAVEVELVVCGWGLAESDVKKLNRRNLKVKWIEGFGEVARLRAEGMFELIPDLQLSGVKLKAVDAFVSGAPAISSIAACEGLPVVPTNFLVFENYRQLRNLISAGVHRLGESLSRGSSDIDLDYFHPSRMRSVISNILHNGS